jgi:hypothetical protein
MVFRSHGGNLHHWAAHGMKLNCRHIFTKAHCIIACPLSPTELLQGWYARNMTGGTIASAAVCPQGYVCPGGTPGGTFDPADPSALLSNEPSIQRCPSGMWTVGVGATSVTECCEWLATEWLLAECTS